jgi:hypothetical protein
LAQSAESKDTKLKVTQVAMFKHGVSYYLLRGEVTGNGRFKLTFKAKEMDDVLKSLLALDTSGKGYISAVGYDAAEDVGHLLESVSLHLPDENVFSSLLTQLQGAQVQVNVGQKELKGTIIGLEPVTKVNGQLISEEKQLVFLEKESGSIRKVAFSDIDSFEILEEGLRKELRFLLDTIISGKKKDSKNLVIQAEGEGVREILVSYIQEAPIWKTTYRLVLPEESAATQEKPIFLSGWVICENVTEFDWEDIKISFIAGVPVSFTYPLFKAMRMVRPVIQPPRATGAAPVEIADEMDQVKYAVAEAGATAGEADREVEAGPDFYARTGKGARPAAPMAAKAEERRRGIVPSEGTTSVAVSTKDFGELFEYDISTPVTIKKKQSALVPILAENVNGRKVLMYQKGKSDQNPAACVEVTNSTKLTLEKGPVTIYYKDNLAGEAMLPFLNKEDTRILNYAVEQGVVVIWEEKSEYQKIHRVSFSGSYLYEHYYQDLDTTYKIRNKIASDKVLYVDHPKTEFVIRDEEKKKQAKETPTTWRFELKLPAKKAIQFMVPERKEISSSYYVLDLDQENLLNKISFYFEGQLIDPKQEKKLREIAATIAEKRQQQDEVTKLEAEINEITQEQDRLRQNLQVLTDSKSERDLKERYVQKFEAQERVIESNRARIKQLSEQIQALDQKANNLMGRM